MLTNIDLTSIGTKQKTELITLATQVQTAIDSQLNKLQGVHRARYKPKNEWTWNDVFQKGKSEGVNGFGTSLSQLYIKVNEAVTLCHDEMAASSSANYMTRRSQGCCLWLAFNMKVAKKMLHDMNLSNLLTIQDLQHVIRLLGDAGVPMQLAIQKPGYAVYTPPGTCSAHFVVWLGEYGEQIAWNHSTTDQGVLDCDDVWKDEEHMDGNSGLDTRRVISKVWLEYQGGRELGMGKEIEVVEKCLKYCEKNGIMAKWWKGQDVDWSCKSVGCVYYYKKNQAINWPIRDLYIDGYCWKCFARSKKLLAVF
jgi:hypothetical protein